MPGKITIFPNKVYGKYKTIEEVQVTTPKGVVETRWKCVHVDTGAISYQRRSRLKSRDQGTLLDDEVNSFLVSKNAHQPGLRKALMIEYKHNAETRAISFDLTLDEFNEIITQPCAYCGTPPNVKNGGHLEHRKRKDQPDLYTLGVDRIDSSKGYTKDNCVPCCTKCNLMKHKYSKEEFLEHVYKIANFNKGSETIPEGSTSQANGDGSGTPRNTNTGEDIVQSLRNIEQFIRERI